MTGTIYSSFIVRSSGTAWSWGRNIEGQLGLGNTTAYSSPKQIGALTTWASVAQGNASQCMAMTKTDGTLWSWGANTGGQLGLGNTTNYSSPKQVGSNTNWLKAGAHTNQSITSMQT